MKEKHICSATVNDKTSRQIMSKMINGYSDEICGCNAKYFEVTTYNFDQRVIHLL